MNLPAKPLYFIVMDQSSGFTEKLFPDQLHLSDGEQDQIRRIKLVILEGIKKSFERGVPREHIGVVIDEPHGTIALQESIREGILTGLSVTLSEQTDDYREYLQSGLGTFSPSFIKSTVTITPENISDTDLTLLKVFSDTCKENTIPFMLELDSESRGNEDSQLEPLLSTLVDADISVDVWVLPSLSPQKINSLPVPGPYVVHTENQPLSDILSLTRVVGFSNQQKTYWDPVIEFFKGRIDGYRAAETIADNITTEYALATQANP